MTGSTGCARQKSLACDAGQGDESFKRLGYSVRFTQVSVMHSPSLLSFVIQTKWFPSRLSCSWRRWLPVFWLMVTIPGKHRHQLTVRRYSNFRSPNPFDCNPFRPYM